MPPFAIVHAVPVSAERQKFANIDPDEHKKKGHVKERIPPPVYQAQTYGIPEMILEMIPCSVSAFSF